MNKLFIFFLLPNLLFSQENLTGKFFRYLMKNESNKAFESLIINSTLSDTEIGMKEIRKIKDTYRLIEENFGIISEYEKYQTKSITERIILTSFFSYHKYTPILWKFLLYKNPGDDWILVNIQLNYNLNELLERDLE